MRVSYQFLQYDPPAELDWLIGPGLRHPLACFVHISIAGRLPYLSGLVIRELSVKAAMQRRAGFTLVEIMITVAIIGLLASLSMPSFVRARTKVFRTQFVNDLRIAGDAFQMYAMQRGGFPPSAEPAVIPEGMTNLLSKMNWRDATSIGGRWEWDFERFGCKAGVSVVSPTFSGNQMAEIDAAVDDGDLTTGSFRSRNGGYIYVVEK